MKRDGFELIRPFLSTVAALLDDDEVTEIMINPGPKVFVERAGRIEPADAGGLTERGLAAAVRNVARVLGADVDEDSPLLDARLPDGSRVAAAFPPAAVGGPALTVRKFPRRRLDLGNLTRLGAAPAWALEELRVAVVERRLNLLVAGGTGSGKTTLVNALAEEVPPEERLVLIEDVAELRLRAPDLLRFESRRPRPGAPGVTARELLRAALRHRPDRIVLGEVRGGEAYELLQALNVGHAGTLSTIHADSAERALSRLAVCALQSGVPVPYPAVRRLIADGLHLIAHLQRRRDGRRLLSEIVRIRDYDPGADRYLLETVYRRKDST